MRRLAWLIAAIVVGLPGAADAEDTYQDRFDKAAARGIDHVVRWLEAPAARGGPVIQGSEVSHSALSFSSYSSSANFSASLMRFCHLSKNSLASG